MNSLSADKNGFTKIKLIRLNISINSIIHIWRKTVLKCKAHGLETKSPSPGLKLQK